MVKKLLIKYDRIIRYLILGFGTFLVNMWAYGFISKVANYSIAYTLAWGIAVLFAYVTNRQWVFESKVSGWQIIPEIIKYYSSRGLTFWLGLVIMWIGVYLMSFNDFYVNIARNAMLLIPNYYLAKFYVFRDKQKKEQAETQVD
ncbi:GtrA family protein [Fructobacillus durionis]|uniref:Putative flippase GtrA (Transmembrane translocase of bactoprenol-linked glucose) n=1 Tax=Fructobacillus durionis TaxID=283737 RepID=A0A1I1FAK3_9LACO|nr:GtrA family protein [Fructobacillus durionis]SFB94110.1 Putative flippase GtrA (transmembrane translocase of bactoprenol-linked glucose) [Fructobacillus durionis]